MNALWTSAGGWMLHTALGGGLLLLVTCVLMRWTRQPARRQRLGDWGITAALLVALCSGLGPSWLVVAWTRGEPVRDGEALLNQAALVEEMPADTLLPVLLEDTPPGLRRGLADEAPSDNAPSWIEQAGMIAMLAAAGVAGFFGLRLLLGYVTLLRLLWRSETAPPEVRGLFDAMATGTRWVRLLVSRRLLVPLSCGLVRPTIVLPASMCQAPAPRQLRWIFAHELTHLRRRDAWSALLFNLGQVFFFALPWFWWLRRQVRLCQEYIADAAAAEQDEGSVEYAEFLVNLANAPAVPVGASAVSGHGSDLSRRVTMLLNDPVRVESRCPRLWTMLVAGGLASLAILVSGFSYRAEAAADDTIIIIIRPQSGGTAKPGDEKKKSEEKVITLLGRVDVNTHVNAIEVTPQQIDVKQKNSPQTVPTVEDLQSRATELWEKMQKAGSAAPSELTDRWRQAVSDLQVQKQRNFFAQQGRFGVLVQSISPGIAEHLKLPSNVGQLVTQVAADSPAAKAGIQVNDILMKIAGALVSANTDDFTKLVASLKDNTPLEVVVLRKGQTLNVGNVKLAGESPNANFTGAKKMAKSIKLYLDGKNGKIVLDAKIDEVDKETMTTTISRKGGTLTITHKEGAATLTVNCAVKDGKVQVATIEVKDGNETQTYDNLLAVPEAHRARVEQLVEALGRLGVAAPKQ